MLDKINSTGADLAGADLSDAELFSYDNLADALLAKANLSHAANLAAPPPRKPQENHVDPIVTEDGEKIEI